MDFENLPWPNKNEDLLELGDDWTHNATLNYSSDELNTYSEGYKHAVMFYLDVCKKTEQN